MRVSCQVRRALPGPSSAKSELANDGNTRFGRGVALTSWSLLITLQVKFLNLSSPAISTVHSAWLC